MVGESFDLFEDMEGSKVASFIGEDFFEIEEEWESFVLGEKDVVLEFFLSEETMVEFYLLEEFDFFKVRGLGAFG